MWTLSAAHKSTGPMVRCSIAECHESDGPEQIDKARWSAQGTLPVPLMLGPRVLKARYDASLSPEPSREMINHRCLEPNFDAALPWPLSRVLHEVGVILYVQG